MLLYYITDRSQFPGSEAERRARLLDRIAEAARAGVDFIQLREKDLSARDLESLSRDAISRLLLETRNQKLATRLLINSRLDIALATGAAGVHLTSTDISASEARAVCDKAGLEHPVIAVSCHSADDVRRAESHGADFVVFGPIFEKSGSPGVGLEALRQACAAPLRPRSLEGAGSSSLPVLALGGVTLANARSCRDAGASGIAAIRLFQSGDLAQVVAALRASCES